MFGMIPEVDDYTTGTVTDWDAYYTAVDAYFAAHLLDQQIIRYADLATA